MPRKSPETKPIVVPLKMPPQLKADIERVTKKSRHLTEQAVMKLALEKGLDAVEKMFAKPEEQAA
jgi:hypothetical protein